MRPVLASGFYFLKLTLKEKYMSRHLLLIYEIKDKAAQVNSKKALKDFERWVKGLLKTYQDAAVEQVAHICLFGLRERFAFGH